MSDISRILGHLNNTGLAIKDNKLYQVIKELIDELVAANKLIVALSTETTPSNEGANPDLTYLTSSDESPNLPNSRELIAGSNVTFDDTTPNERTIDVTTSSGIDELTGDVTAGPGTGSQVATIPNDTITFAKMQNISTQRAIGRDTAGTGNPEEITVTQILDWTP